jgi:hypothetical protein
MKTIIYLTALAAIAALPVAGAGQLQLLRVRLISFNHQKAPLSDGDITAGQSYKVPFPATLVEVSAQADAGTPAILLAKNHGGLRTDLLSRPLATANAGRVTCANASGIVGLDGYKCSATLQNTALSRGDLITTRKATAGGIASQLMISVAIVEKREEK